MGEIVGERLRERATLVVSVVTRNAVVIIRALSAHTHLLYISLSHKDSEISLSSSFSPSILESPRPLLPTPL